jgi:carboxypeptidase T
MAPTYHCWHFTEFDGKAPFSTLPIDIPRLAKDGKGSEKKTLASMMNDLDELRRIGQQKGICDAQRDIGKSFRGRELWLLKVGKNADQKILFTGCHHAREWISVEVPFLVAKFLVENYEDAPVDPRKKRIKHLVDNRQIWFVPISNPDGHFASQTEDRAWRANRRLVPMAKQTIKAPQLGGGTRDIKVEEGKFLGVDINRNYPRANWGQETYDQEGWRATSRDPKDGGANAIWGGPEAGSEPETQRIVSLFDHNTFRANLTFHNFSQLLLFPDDAESDAYTQFIGKGMDGLIKEKGNPYTYQKSSKLYPVTGDQSGFAWDRTKRPTFTPELRPTHDNDAFGFSALPDDQIAPCFREMLPACLALINAAGFDAVPGKVKVTVPSSDPVAQVVQNAWKPFQGWEP